MSTYDYRPPWRSDTASVAVLDQVSSREDREMRQSGVGRDVEPSGRWS